MLDEFDRSKKRRGRAGSFDGKPSSSLTKPVGDFDAEDHDKVFKRALAKKGGRARRDSNDSLKMNKRR